MGRPLPCARLLTPQNPKSKRFNLPQRSHACSHPTLVILPSHRQSGELDRLPPYTLCLPVPTLASSGVTANARYLFSPVTSFISRPPLKGIPFKDKKTVELFLVPYYIHVYACARVSSSKNIGHIRAVGQLITLRIVTVVLPMLQQAERGIGRNNRADRFSWGSFRRLVCRVLRLECLVFGL